jgi:hypothetical protein
VPPPLAIEEARLPALHLAAFSSRRRAALFVDSRRTGCPPSAIRQGPISCPGRVPDAARVRTLRGSARGRRTSCGVSAAATEAQRHISGAAFGLLRLKTPHEAPLCEQGARNMFLDHGGSLEKISPRDAMP